MECYAVAGTQAEKSHDNRITLMHLTNLQKTKNDDDEDDDEIDDDGDDSDPLLYSVGIPHNGSVNRIRSMYTKPQIVATWSDIGKIFIWDVSEPLHNLTSTNNPKPTWKINPLYTVKSHTCEGYGLDWSNVSAGHLLSGDVENNIYHTMPTNSGWSTDIIPFKNHNGSVEDIQWSPNEAEVFASCSVDKTIAIGDLRNRSGAMISVVAHKSDVNVISWNKLATHMLLSGSDDGSFKIWDLRHFKSNEPVANYKWYNCPVTSVEWSSHESSVLSVSGDDGQLTLWDLSLERDADDPKDVDVPPQLLFVHRGQKYIKELHFHSQIPEVILSTAEDGFNIFKPDTQPEEEEGEEGEDKKIEEDIKE